MNARDLCCYRGDEAGYFRGFGEVGGYCRDVGAGEEGLQGGHGGGTGVRFTGGDDQRACACVEETARLSASDRAAQGKEVYIPGCGVQAQPARATSDYGGLAGEGEEGWVIANLRHSACLRSAMGEMENRVVEVVALSG